ncbi:MAG TPA: hypothetical protein VF631_08150 [Allosphingosinicella sp.]|jgi:hypothetical protein|uniref:hypothetical protein n=1 Tax=Allosphingosinicella sp. TaxID=2823234 RepID=UPI002F298C0E
MAYLDLANAYPATLGQSGFAIPQQQASAQADGLSALEWSVVALARRDRISSLGQPSRIATAMGRLFGTHSNPQLADPRLEALRRLAVLAWHRGYVLPKSEMKRFLTAGFTTEQFEILLRSISGARTATQRR